MRSCCPAVCAVSIVRGSGDTTFRDVSSKGNVFLDPRNFCWGRGHIVMAPRKICSLYIKEANQGGHKEMSSILDDQ